MIKTKMARRVLIGVLILGTLGGLIWFATRPKPVEVEVITITRGDVAATAVNTRAGTVKACRRAKLAPAGGGQIVKLWVKEGDRVDKGQPLLELWNTDLAAKRDLAHRQLASAQERRREACIVAENSRRQAERTHQLATKGFLSPQASENADAEARARQASCDATASDVKSAQAEIRVSQAGLERSVLIAPFAGVVALITGELGEYTTPSPPGIPTPPAVDLIDDTCLYVTAPMDEVDAPKLKVGQSAKITLDALPGQFFAGRIRRIAPYVTEVEKQARTVDVEVNFEEPPKNSLLVGYSADIEIVIQRRENVLRIPTQAVRQNEKVLVLDKDNKLEERRVEIGLANWAFTEVVSGLKEGDQVLLSSDQDVKAGMQVKRKTTQS